MFGVTDTLQAVQEGRVDTLVVSDGLTLEGTACGKCDYLSAEAFAACPRCSGPGAAIPDVIDRAIERALLADGHVEVIIGEARERLLDRGGLGALLRY